MAHQRRLWILPSLLTFVLSLTMAIDRVAAYDWPQFGGNPQHSGNNTLETAINSANVNSLSQKFQVTLTARVDGTPVFMERVSTPAGIKDLLFMTTFDGRILAIDAQDGSLIWGHQYGPGTCRINNNVNAALCYTTSSPAIDPNRQYVYSYGLDGYAHKYLAGNGTEITTGGWPQLTTLKGFDEKGSSALSIASSGGSSYLYVSHGGYPGDQGDYQGHVTAIDLATGAQNVFNMACSGQSVHFQSTSSSLSPTCPSRQNAVWSRPGVVYDAGTNRIFMGTGNAFSASVGRFDGVKDWSESVVALQPDGTGGSGSSAGKPLDSYTPGEHNALDDADADVGSTAPAILPVSSASIVQHLAVQGGKDAKLRLINLSDLSGMGGPGHTDGSVAPTIAVPQGGGVLSQPAVWINPADSSTWIFVVNGSGASALRLNIDGSGRPSLITQWSIGQGGTSPIVANGIVFYIDGGTVRAVDAVSGTQLWSVANPGGRHWESLVVANGTVYATDESSHLTAYAIVPAMTATTVASSFNPSTAGANVSLTATITGSNPGGSVNFTDSGTSISGCAAVALAGAGNSRTATCNVASLSVGTHSIVAVYSGDAGNASSTSPALSQVVTVPSGASRGDFNADGRSDILLRRASDGTVMMWLMNGMGIASVGTVGTGTDWSVAGTGDFNGDGKADILMRRASDGAIMMWLMNGMGVSSVGIIGTGTDWSVAGVGDFNGDGKADILLRRASDGAIMMWLMNGMAVSSVGIIGMGTDWSVAGIGDFNGDGKSDVLLRRGSDGSVMMWLMNGMAVTSSGIIGSGTDWSIAGAADFNGDGKSDILWRRGSDGAVMMWLMNGMAVASNGVIGTGTDWSIAGAGDFNGDGKADILWRRASDGSIMMWLMNGMAVSSLGTVGSGVEWVVAAPR